MTLRDVTLEPHPKPCPDCGRAHLNGEHIRFQVPAPGSGGMRASRVVWEGCADCWIARTNPSTTPAPCLRVPEPDSEGNV